MWFIEYVVLFNDKKRLLGLRYSYYDSWLEIKCFKWIIIFNKEYIFIFCLNMFVEFRKG